ncbi:hypothetical protein ElyMa_000643800 [Elysia marginata]|uniref:Uncharacterized protein n=1 Tax=Elysia marginata TaxID=1093978 RepID=A0AAV4GBY9_9GAST|nr:hypothetical protein ElyMa_000643800 [Elysia marginata]
MSLASPSRFCGQYNSGHIAQPRYPSYMSANPDHESGSIAQADLTSDPTNNASIGRAGLTPDNPLPTLYNQLNGLRQPLLHNLDFGSTTDCQLNGSIFNSHAYQRSPHQQCNLPGQPLHESESYNNAIAVPHPSTNATNYNYQAMEIESPSSHVSSQYYGDYWSHPSRLLGSNLNSADGIATNSIDHQAATNSMQNLDLSGQHNRWDSNNRQVDHLNAQPIFLDYRTGENSLFNSNDPERSQNHPIQLLHLNSMYSGDARNATSLSTPVLGQRQNFMTRGARENLSLVTHPSDQLNGMHSNTPRQSLHSSVPPYASPMLITECTPQNSQHTIIEERSNPVNNLFVEGLEPTQLPSDELERAQSSQPTQSFGAARTSFIYQRGLKTFEPSTVSGSLHSDFLHEEHVQHNLSSSQESMPHKRHKMSRKRERQANTPRMERNNRRRLSREELPSEQSDRQRASSVYSNVNRSLFKDDTVMEPSTSKGRQNERYEPTNSIDSLLIHQAQPLRGTGVITAADTTMGESEQQRGSQESTYSFRSSQIDSSRSIPISQNLPVGSTERMVTDENRNEANQNNKLFLLSDYREQSESNYSGGLPPTNSDEDLGSFSSDEVGIQRQPNREDSSTLRSRLNNRIGGTIRYQCYLLNNILESGILRPWDHAVMLELRFEVLRSFVILPHIQIMDYLIRRCAFLDFQWQPDACVLSRTKRLHALLDEVLLPYSSPAESSLRIFSRFFDSLFRPSYDSCDRAYNKVTEAFDSYSKKVHGRVDDDHEEDGPLLSPGQYMYDEVTNDPRRQSAEAPIERHDYSTGSMPDDVNPFGNRLYLQPISSSQENDVRRHADSYTDALTYQDHPEEYWHPQQQSGAEISPKKPNSSNTACSQGASGNFLQSQVKSSKKKKKKSKKRRKSREPNGSSANHIQGASNNFSQPQLKSSEKNRKSKKHKSRKPNSSDTACSQVARSDFSQPQLNLLEKSRKSKKHKSRKTSQNSDTSNDQRAKHRGGSKRTHLTKSNTKKRQPIVDKLVITVIDPQNRKPGGDHGSAVDGISSHFDRLKATLSRLTSTEQSQPTLTQTKQVKFEVKRTIRVVPQSFEQRVHLHYQCSRNRQRPANHYHCYGENANFVTSYTYFKGSNAWVKTVRSPCGAIFVTSKNKHKCSILYIKEADGHLDIFVRRPSGHTTIVSIGRSGRINVLFQAWPEEMTELSTHHDGRVDLRHFDYLSRVVEMLNRSTRNRRK